MLPPARLMQAVSLAAWLLSLASIYWLLRTMAVALPALGALAIALYPFIGVFEVAYPRADALASLALSLALLFYNQQRRWPMILAIALGLLVHKALWPFLGLIVLIGLWQRRLTLLQALLTGLPLVLYWLYGAIQFGDLTWIVSANIAGELTSRSTLPILDGLLGTLLNGSITGIVKFGILAAVMLLALGLLLLRQHWQEHPVLYAVTIPVILFGLALNQFEIWAVVRYSKFLVLPLWVVLEQKNWQIAGFNLKQFIWPVLIVFFLTQLAFAYYSAQVYVF